MLWSAVRRRFRDKGYKPRLQQCDDNKWIIKLIRDRRFRYRCPCCQTTHLRIKRTYWARARDEPLGNTIRIVIDYPAVTAYCAYCERHITFRPPMIHPTAQVTRRYMKFISAECRAHRGYAERYLRDWVDWVEDSGLHPLIRLARGLWRDR